MMKKYQAKVTECPDCGNVLKTKRKCGCGWKMEDIAEPVITDDRCQYTSNGHRCPNPGTMSPHPYGKHGPWYCSRHWQYSNDPSPNQYEEVQEQENYENVIEERVDWRRRLFPDEQQIFKSNHLKSK